MSGYETGLIWGLIAGAPLVGVFFWAAKKLIDQHFEERARQAGLSERRGEEPTWSP